MEVKTEKFSEFAVIEMDSPIHGRTNTPRKFWSKVAITANPEKCWEWQGGLNKKGYGYFKYKDKQWRAHRLAWFFANGQINENLLVRHYVCDNPSCCNPSHLRQGTNGDNMQDRNEHNRQAKGTKHGLSKLTEEKVREIKLLLSRGLSGVSIAKKFSVGKDTISQIKLNKIWRHVEN